MYLIYNSLLFLSAFFLVPYYALRIMFTGKYRKSIGPKFGFIPPAVFDGMTGEPRIWVHAVSVGEVTAAAPIVTALRGLLPGACIVLSVSTETGREMAGKIVPEQIPLIYYPLDIPCVVRKIIGLVKPDIFVPVETEVWPNFIRSCRAAGSRIVMVNGRISPRSFGRYRLTRFFWKDVLACFDKVGVISAVDAERVRALGVSSSRIQVLGNAKFDGLAAKADPRVKEEIAGRLGVKEGNKVFVAGSTHEGEEEIVFRVYRKLLAVCPDFRLIIVPRHIERGQEVFALARGSGFSDAITMTEIRKGRRPSGERVIIIDVIGELFKVYGLATLVFCGGSLVPKGGQNILEPAAWGKVVCYGPSMEDFRDEKALLEDVGAGIPVQNEGDLYSRLVELLGCPQELIKRGEAGREMIAANMGASKRYAELIQQALTMNHPL